MKPFCAARFTDGVWFRIFGYGLSVAIASRSRRYFSERIGKVKFLYFAGLKIGSLKP